MDKELANIEEKPAPIPVNGLDSPSSSERSRSPSPTLEMPSYSINSADFGKSAPFSYTNSVSLPNSNSLNDFYPDENRQQASISQILKEANSMSVNNQQDKTKVAT